MNRLATSLCLIGFMVLAGNPASLTQTQSQLSAQSCNQFGKVDKEMNETYATILKEYAKDPQFITKLRAAQRAWLAFRDAELEAHYPRADKQAEYGSVYPMCRCSEMQSLTENRTKQLKRWLIGTAEGEICAGSVRVSQ
jgi:uncharacterized protein YecT (DUF1311 family)